LSLDGMFRVDRERLAAIKPAAALRELVGSGAMESVYAHLLSQENFRRLLSRRGFFARRPGA
ncbi:MAG TPA: SapC family protein, partial [Burkholderiales bacterium]